MERYFLSDVLLKLPFSLKDDILLKLFHYYRVLFCFFFFYPYSKCKIKLDIITKFCSLLKCHQMSYVVGIKL